MNRPFWDKFSAWQEADYAWEEQKKNAAIIRPLKGLTSLPNIPGMTKETARFLKIKSLLWMVYKDSGFQIMRHVLSKPFVHAYRYVKSIFKKSSYIRDTDFFYYGVKSAEEFSKQLENKNSIFVIGFSYCEKPHECPSGRFNDACVHDLDNSVCQQCFIGKARHALPQTRTIPLIIPTIHYIGNKIFEIMQQNPGKKILFLITACEMTLEMFGDWGNLAGITGIGVRLDGRICNTMRAFKLSEEGIKPGLTLVLPETRNRIFNILQRFREYEQQ